MLSYFGGTRIALPGLLLASLALNGLLLLRAPASASHIDTPQNQSQGATSRSAATRARPDALAQCRHQLRLQKLRVVHLTRGQLVALQQAPGTPSDDVEEPENASPRDSSFGAQQEMLCTLGLEELRRNWESGKDLIHNNLARDLASSDAQAADLNRTLTGFGDALNLSHLELSQLEKRYVPLRSRRVSTALDALETDPPDYLAAFDEALDLYHETDALVQDLYGSDAVDKVRSAELRRRTHVLAVLASLADVGWDSSIEW